MESPCVSVVICHHTQRLITRCLESVRKSRFLGGLDVTVVTSDPTYVNTDIRLYYLEDGPAAKRNLGVAKAQYDTIVFLDDDVEINPHCLYELCRFLTVHPKCGIAFAKIYKMEEGRRNEFDAAGSWLTWTGFLWDRAGNGQTDRRQFNTPERCLSSKSATCSVSRKAFLAVNGFDPAYYILGEETDLAWRMWLRGWECWYVPSAVSWHAFGCESLKPKADHYTIERTMTYGCRNYLSLLWTNLGPLRLLGIFPIHLSAWACAAIGFILRKDVNRAMGILRGMQEFCQRLPTLQRKRRYVQSTRIISDHILWPSIAVNPSFFYYMTRLWRYWTTQLHG